MKDEVIWQDSQYAILRRKPTLANLVPTKLRQSSTHEKLRWLVQYLYGYQVYVLVENTNANGGGRKSATALSAMGRISVIPLRIAAMLLSGHIMFRRISAEWDWLRSW